MIDVLIRVNGVPRRVPADVTIAAALLRLGHMALRTDSGGAPRSVHCGMGICYECQVTVDGATGVRGCLALVREGMSIEVPGA